MFVSTQVTADSEPIQVIETGPSAGSVLLNKGAARGGAGGGACRVEAEIATKGRPAS